MEEVILKSLFDVLLTAMLLTIFEVVFFGWEISKKITTTVGNLVNSFATTLGSNVDGIFRLPGNMTEAIAEEEAILVNDYNESVMYDGWWIVGLLFMGLLGTGGYLYKHDQFSSETVKNTAILSLGTTVLFIIFQLYFFYGITTGDYKYPTQKESQLIATDAMIKTLEDDLNPPPESE